MTERASPNTSCLVATTPPSAWNSERTSASEPPWPVPATSSRLVRLPFDQVGLCRCLAKEQQHPDAGLRPPRNEDDFHGSTTFGNRSAFGAIWVVVNPPRKILSERLNARIFAPHGVTTKKRPCESPCVGEWSVETQHLIRVEKACFVSPHVRCGRREPCIEAKQSNAADQLLRNGCPGWFIERTRTRQDQRSYEPPKRHLNGFQMVLWIIGHFWLTVGAPSSRLLRVRHAVTVQFLPTRRYRVWLRPRPLLEKNRATILAPRPHRDFEGPLLAQHPFREPIVRSCGRQPAKHQIAASGSRPESGLHIA